MFWFKPSTRGAEAEACVDIITRNTYRGKVCSSSVCEYTFWVLRKSAPAPCEEGFSVLVSSSRTLMFRLKPFTYGAEAEACVDLSSHAIHLEENSVPAPCVKSEPVPCVEGFDVLPLQQW